MMKQPQPQPSQQEQPVLFTANNVKETNDAYRGVLRIVRNKYDGDYGLIANRDFEKGDYIMTGSSKSSSKKKGTHTIQTNYDTHVIMDLPAILINHSCFGNVGIVDNPKSGAYDFYAIQSISKETELVWDYETAEYEITNFPKCGCRQKEYCRTILRGYKVHGSIVRQQYGSQYIANYLLTSQNKTDN